MKDEYETELFDDGTEPTVKRLPYGADYQGRHPEAAEPCTDVGQDDGPREDVTWFWVVVLGIFVGVVIAAAWERMA